MNTPIKTKIKSGLLAGLIFTILMAGFDYSKGQDFSIFKFIFHFLFFGLIMGLITKIKNPVKRK